jgi:hypothetical protein
MQEVFSNKAEKVIKPERDVVVTEVKKMKEEGGFDGWWKGVIAAPDNFRFESQNEHEVVLLLMRQHWITNIWWILMTSMLFFVPAFWSEFPLLSSVSEVVKFDMTVLWYMALGFFAFQKFLLWFYNIYVVTDERVIDVDFFGIMYKNINVAQLIKIEDVNYSQGGIFASFFNYGDVVIQTASEQRSADVFGGEASAFTFSSVPNPDRVVRVISELIEQEQQESVEGRIR